MPDILSALQSISGVPENQQVSRDQLVRAVQNTAPSTDGYNIAASMDMGLTFPDQIINRYDPNYNAVMNARQQGYNQYLRDANNYSDEGVLSDSLNALTNAVHGGLRSLTDIASVSMGAPLDLIANIAGSDVQPSVALSNALSGTLDNIAEAVHTDAYNRRQQALSAQANAQLRDSEYQYNRDISNGDSALAATGKQILRDIGNWADRQTPYDALMSGAEVTGQVLGQGGLIRAGTKIAGKASKLVSDGVRKFANRVKTPAVIGMTEASANYTDMANRISEMSYEELERNSPVFPSLVQENLDKGMSLDNARETARNTLAGMVARRNFAYTFPTAVLAGRLSASGVERPFSAATRALGNTSSNTLGGAVRRTLGNATDAAGILGEATEETLQGVSGTLVQQFIDRSLVNRNQRVGQGLGDVIAESATGGAIGRAVTSLPGSVVRATADLARGTANTISPVASATGSVIKDKVAPAVSGVVDKATSAINTFNQKQQIKRATKKLEEGESTTATSKEAVDMQNLFRDAFSNINYEGTGLSNVDENGNLKSTSKSFEDLINTVANPKKDKAQRIRAAIQFKNVLSKLTDIVKNNKDIEKAINSQSLSDNDKLVLGNFQEFINDQESLDELNNIIKGVFKQQSEDLAEQTSNDTISQDSSLRSEQGRNNARDTLQNDTTLENIDRNINTAQTIALHAEELGMSDQEKAAWQGIVDTLKHYKTIISDSTNSGNTSSIDDITDQYFTSENPDNYETGKVSAKQLIDDMLAESTTNEFRSGDTNTLNSFKSKLDNLKRLYDIANNKLQALKRSYNNNGTRERYTTYNPKTNEAYDYEVYADKSNVNSLNFMKEVSDAAKALYGLYNNFISAYPREVSSSGSIPSALTITEGQLDLPSDFTNIQQKAGTKNASSSYSRNQSNGNVNANRSNTAKNNDSYVGTRTDKDRHNDAINAFNSGTRTFKQYFAQLQIIKAKELRGEALTEKEQNIKNKAINYFNKQSRGNLRLDVARYIINSNNPELLSYRGTPSTGSITVNTHEPEVRTEQVQQEQETGVIGDVIKSAKKEEPEGILFKTMQKVQTAINDKKLNNTEKHNYTAKVARDILFKNNDKSPISLKPEDSFTDAFSKLNELVANTFKKFKNKYSNVPALQKAVDKYLASYVKSLADDKVTHHPVNIVISNLESIFNKLLGDKGNNVSIFDLLNSDKALLTFTHKNQKGKVELDDNVKVAVGAATIGFVSDLNNYFGNKTQDRVTEDYDINPNEMSSEDLNILAQGADINLLVRNMNNRLLNLLGISINNLPEEIDGNHAISSLSLLALQNLIGMKILEPKTVTTASGNKITVLVPGEAMNKQDNRYTSIRLTGIRKKIWNEATNTIEDKREFFMDEEMPDVDTISKLRSRAAYTPIEKKAIEGHRRQKYFINTPFYNFMNKLGVNGIIELFFTPFEKDEEGNYPVINKNTQASIEGKNRTLLNSYVYNTERYDTAKAIGGDNAYIRIDYRITRNGRYQETLAYGPNSDKLSRQMFTVVHDEYDLNQRIDRVAFGKTLAQAFGIDTKKIINENVYSELVTNIQTVIRDTYAGQTIGNRLQKEGLDFLNNIDNPVAFIQNIFDRIGTITFQDSNGKTYQLDSEVSYLGINAILNTIRSIQNPKFTMNVALEGDSTAAGIGDATAKASCDPTYTGNQIQTMWETGHMVGTDTTYAESKEIDPDDAYTRSANLATQKANEFVQKNPELNSVSQDVIDLAALCGLTGSYKKGDGKLTFTRQIAKKMATPMTYQQGINSATRGILNMIGDFMHQHISDMLLAKKANPKLSQAEAFFSKEGYPKQEAEERFNALISKLDNLSTIRIKNENGIWIIDKDSNNQTISKNAFRTFFRDSKESDYQNFTFNDFLTQIYKNNRNQENNLFNNIKYLFTKPMYDGVNEVRGEGVRKTGDSIIASSGIISLVQGYRTLKKRREIRKETGYYPSRRFMEKLQRNGVDGKLNSIYKFKDSTTNLELTSMGDSVPSGRPVRSLDGSLSYQNRLFITGNPGVSPFPLTIVATTDGSIQTRLFAQEDFVGADRYDGLEYNAKDAASKAQQMNKAAREVILDNILKPFADKFNTNKQTLIDSMKDLDEELVTVEQELEAINQQYPDISKAPAPVRANHLDANTYLQNLTRIKREVSSIFRTYRNNNPDIVINNEGINLGITMFDNNGNLDYEKAFNLINDDLQKRSNNLDRKLAVLKSTPINEQHMSADNTRVGFGLENAERLAQYTTDTNTVEAKAQRVATVMNQRMNSDDTTIPIDSESMQRITYPSINTFTKDSLNTLLDNTFKDKTEVSIFIKKFVKTNLNSETKVLIGNREDVTNYVRTYHNHDFDPEVTRGFAIPGSNTIILIDNNHGNKTILAHELIHAVTSMKIAKLANIKESEVSGLSEEERLSWRALKNIEDLYGQFARHVDTLRAIPATERTDRQNEYISLYQSMENAGTRERQLQEFMAYAMTDNRLRSYFRSNRASEAIVNRTRDMNHIMGDIKDVFIKVRNAIGKFLHINISESKRTGDTKLNEPTLNALTALEYNTAVIIDTNININTNTDINTNVNHYVDTDSDPRLSQVMSNINKAVSAAINSGTINVSGSVTRVSKDNLKNLWEEDTGASSIYNEFIVEAVNNGFTLSNQQAQTMKMVMSVFNTGMGLNPILKVEAENLRKIVLDKLSSEDFLDTSSSPEEAQNKYDLLANTSGSVIENITAARSNSYAASPRDVSLALFMGLATVNPEVRSVLEKLTINRNDYADSRRPVSQQDISKPDELLNKLGTRVVDFITEQVTHQPASANAMKIVDSYINTIKDTSFKMNALNIPSNILAKGDAAITKYVLDKLPGILDSKAYKALEEATSGSRIANTILYALNMGISLAGPDTGEYSSKQLTREITAFAAKNPGLMGRFLTVTLNELMFPDENMNTLQRVEKKYKTEMQIKRQVYRETVPNIILQQFADEGVQLSDEDTKTLNTAYLKCDAGALSGSELNSVFGSTRDRNNLKNQLEQIIAQNVSSKAYPIIFKKMNQLSNFMLTGISGPNLLRNADAIAHLLGENINPQIISEGALIKAIDKWVTINALEHMEPKQFRRTRELYYKAPKASSYAISQQRSLRTKEVNDARNSGSDRTRFNAFKGYVPFSNRNDSVVKVINAAELKQYEQMGYIKVGTYTGPRIENSPAKVIVANTVNPIMSYATGAMPTTNMTVGGVDKNTGYRVGLSAGRIVNPAAIAQYRRNLYKDTGIENFSPVYDDNGTIVALERTLDPKYMNHLRPELNFAKNLGNWWGRQVEEEQAKIISKELITIMHNMWENASPREQRGYIDLWEAARTDKVLADALSMMTPEARAEIRKQFGNKFMVRADMVNDLLGHRRASIVDSFTGRSQFSPTTQKAIVNLARMVAGDNAFKKLYRTERFVMGTVSSARNWIVVRSLTVMVDNLLSNLFQLVSRGVPITTIMKETPRLLKQIETYNNYRIQKIKLQADLQALRGEGTLNQYKINAVQNQIKALEESVRNLEIMPLVRAGEYNTIADVGDTPADLQLSMGRWGDFIEDKVNQLPKSIRTAGKYAIISRDTALYRGLEKGVQYGDFIAKAILYKHLMSQPLANEDRVLDRIRYEFVNYDMLAGRSREYLENIGLLWFYNFKLRTTRVAFSMLRNNPLHALVFLGMPNISDIGSPLTDNLLSKILGGGILGSVGPGMGLDFFTKNLWGQMFL